MSDPKTSIAAPSTMNDEERTNLVSSWSDQANASLGPDATVDKICAFIRHKFGDEARADGQLKAMFFLTEAAEDLLSDGKINAERLALFKSCVEEIEKSNAIIEEAAREATQSLCGRKRSVN